MSVEDIRRLVEKERESEEQLKKAEEEASRIVEQAKAEAKEILSNVENERYIETLAKEELKGIEEKKKALENDCDEVLENLKSTADENMGKTVALILTLVFGE